MNDEKKLSDEELKDVAGGVKTYNTSKSNTSSSVDDKKDETKPTLESGEKGK